jgi:hypothetical protein
MTLQNKLIAALAALLFYVSSMVGIYFYVKSDLTKAVQHSALTSYQKGVENNEKIDKGIRGMGLDSLDSGLSHWLRPTD